MPRHATPPANGCARPTHWPAGRCALAVLLLVGNLGAARAADPGDAAGHAHKPVANKPVAAHAAPGKAAAKPVAEPADGSLAGRLKAAMADPKHAKGELVIDAATLAAARPAGPAPQMAAWSPTHASTHTPAHTPAHPPAAAHNSPEAARAVAGRVRAHAAAVAGHDAHWAYAGENGPQAWAKLKPEFNVCAIGKRQSPIHIEDAAALPGPAEPLQLAYRASGGSVVNNGHTIQVDLDGDNTLNVRGTTYRLVQFHFHHPAEEMVNHKGFAMVAHLVHKSDDGRLAVVAVLMDPGAPSPLVEKVWTHMPLDTADRVRLPAGLIDMNELLPKDQRYYQFIGSLTTPPCTEGVLWLVLKQPMTLARDQLRLFAQQFPNNARPVQALNGRTVREAQ